MNFLEAVQALNDGQCDTIRRHHWMPVFGYKLNMNGNVINNQGSSVNTLADLLADDWQLVNPKPVTETVEVKRWACICDGIIIDTANSKRRLEEIYCDDSVFIELSGTYEKPVKPKVKRREKCLVDGFSCSQPHPRTGLTFYVEWEE